MVDARAMQEIRQEKEKRWHGIDLCVGGKESWGKNDDAAEVSG